MSGIRLGVVLWFVPLLPAQQPVDAALPTVSRLGPLPDSVPVVGIEPSGAMRCGERELEVALVGAREVVLRAATETGTAAVFKAIDRLRSHQIERVHFAARLPVGEAIGCVALGLGDPATATADLDLRLSLDRPGVPPECLSPHLQRMADGVLAANRSPLSLRVVVPPDGTWGNLLAVLAAIAHGGAPAVVLSGSAAATKDAPVRRDAFALDLGPAPAIQILPTTMAPVRPEVGTGRVGLEAAGPKSAPTKEAAEATSGRKFGGRVRGRRPSPKDRIGPGLDWLSRNQLPDGGWAGMDGKSDVETTAWVVLSILADGGASKDTPAAAALTRGLGFLVAHQAADGQITDTDGVRVRRHALATYALAEASGLWPQGYLVRGSAAAALQWLYAHKSRDGGWSDDGTGTGDPLVTAYVAMAVETARFFALPAEVDQTQLLAWLPERMPMDSDAKAPLPEAVPAVLFARIFLGVDTKPLAQTAAVLLERCSLGDERACYWTTYVMFQIGGRPWNEWSKKLMLLPNPNTNGPLAGSWDPQPRMSRALASALRVLAIQAYYRYTKIIR